MKLLNRLRRLFFGEYKKRPRQVDKQVHTLEDEQELEQIKEINRKLFEHQVQMYRYIENKYRTGDEGTRAALRRIFVRPYDLSVTGGKAKMTLQKLGSKWMTLHAILEQKNVSENYVFYQLWPRIVEAVDTAHGLGIAHLDLHDKNIMVHRRSGQVRLIDLELSVHQRQTVEHFRSLDKIPLYTALAFAIYWGSPLYVPSKEKITFAIASFVDDMCLAFLWLILWQRFRRPSTSLVHDLGMGFALHYFWDYCETLYLDLGIVVVEGHSDQKLRRMIAGRVGEFVWERIQDSIGGPHDHEDLRICQRLYEGIYLHTDDFLVNAVGMNNRDRYTGINDFVYLLHRAPLPRITTEGLRQQSTRRQMQQARRLALEAAQRKADRSLGQR